MSTTPRLRIPTARRLAGACLCLLAAACGTARAHILPGQGGLNRAISSDVERDGAQTAAVEAAEEYCKKQNKTAVFTGAERTAYRGSMDEGTRNAVRAASRATGFIAPLGSNSPLSVASQTGHHMTSNRDYESEFEFECK